MPISCCRWFAVLLVAALLGAISTGAHAQGAPVAGKKLALGGEAGTKSARFAFQSEKGQPPLLASPDPTAGFELLVRGTGAGAGRSALVQIGPDASLWKLLGKPASPKGWQYKNRTGARGGVRKVVLEGGQLRIDAKGPLWSFVPDGAQGSVQVAVKIGADWVCAEFGGEVKRDEAGRFEAKAAPAPAACELEVCGNGTVDPGEACDDGNVVDGDGCTNACQVGCTPDYASTFAAIQGVIIDDYGCTGGFCHGSNDPPGGELRLLPDVAYSNLVNVASSEVPSVLRVKPGDASASFLYEKLSSSSPQGGGSQMPLVGGPLKANELEAVRVWIEGGAPETGTVPGTADLLGVCLP